MPARVLIIEDNPANLELSKYLLETHGYSTMCATDGGEGVRIVRDARPDLVLCDLQMPVLDGYAVLSAIRSDPALSDMPVVAVTAFSMPSDCTQALSAGFDGYMSKPLDPERFVAQIEAFLRPELHAGRRPDVS